MTFPGMNNGTGKKKNRMMIQHYRKRKTDEKTSEIETNYYLHCGNTWNLINSGDGYLYIP